MEQYIWLSLEEKPHPESVSPTRGLPYVILWRKILYMREHHYIVYMLHCGDGSYYTGMTNDLEARLWQHETGEFPTCYTFTRRPVKLVYATSFDYVYHAIGWEKHIKRWSRKKKEALIREDETGLKALAECQNKSHSKNKGKCVMVSGVEP